MGKTVTLKNIDLLNAMGSLKELLKIDDKTFPIKARWNIMKDMKTFESGYKTYSEMELELLKQYAIKDTNGEVKFENNEPKFAPNNKKEYITKRDELLQCENEFDILTVKLDDLENHVPNGEILYFLEFMIEE